MKRSCTCSLRLIQQPETVEEPVPKVHMLHFRIASLLPWLMYSIPSTLHVSGPRSSHLDFRTFRAQPPARFGAT